MGLVSVKGGGRWTAPAGGGGGGSSRIESSDLTYEGSFRLPDPTGVGFGYIGYSSTRQGMCFNPAGDGGAGSLFIIGEGAKHVAEVTIPSVDSGITTLGSLPTATTLQNFADPAEGQWAEIEATDTSNVFIRGMCVHNGRLIVSAYHFYLNTDSAHLATHFSRPLNLSTTGDVRGAVRLTATELYSGDIKRRFTAGNMTAIPAAVQSAYGLGPVAVGGGGGSIISNLSAGPSIFAFDPDEITNSVSEISAVPLCYYPHAVHPVSGEARHLQALFGYDLGEAMPVSHETNDWWGSPSFASIVAWCESRPVVLCIGSHGYGNSWYGLTDGAGDPVYSTDGTPTPDPAIISGTPGNHAYPYRIQVWAYDQSELIAVATEAKLPWKAQPYAVWGLSTPFDETHVKGWHAGFAHDPATRRIFVAEALLDGSKPLIHVYTYPAS